VERIKNRMNTGGGVRIEPASTALQALKEYRIINNLCYFFVLPPPKKQALFHADFGGMAKI
jgi:hypothetical protein